MIKQFGVLFLATAIISSTLCTAPENSNKQPSYRWLKFKYRGLQIVVLGAIGLNFVDQTTKKNVCEQLKNLVAKNETIKSVQHELQKKYELFKEKLSNASFDKSTPESLNNDQMQSSEHPSFDPNWLKNLAESKSNTNVEPQENSKTTESSDSLDKKDNN